MSEFFSGNFREKVEHVLRKAAGEKVRLAFIEEWGIGALNACYYIRTKEPEQRFFLKIENDNIIPTTRRGQIEREVEGIRLMKKAGISCPDVLRYDFSKDEIGRKYMLQNFIDAQLLWEVKDELKPEEHELIKGQIDDIVEKMKGVTSPYFGDIYGNGAIGQHFSWKDAFKSMWNLLTEDGRALELFTDSELKVLGETLDFCKEQLVFDGSASFYHGDLGNHNVLIGNFDGLRGIGTVIDYGNSLFVPFYLNEDGVRRYGGWGLEITDPCEKHSISRRVYELGNLVFEFEGTIFFSMLMKRRGSSTGEPVERLINRCREVMSDK